MSSDPHSAACTVYFDGACPLCRREIDHYRRKAQHVPVAWVDVSSCDAAELGSDLDRATALARMHVRRADGRLVSGAAAFAEIWRLLPAYAWLARLAARPRLLAALEAGYVAFLGLRRLWRRPGAAMPASARAMPIDPAAVTGGAPAREASARGRSDNGDRR